MKLYDNYCTPKSSYEMIGRQDEGYDTNRNWWKRGKSSNPVNSLLSYSPVKVITYLGFGPLRITSTAWKGLFYDDE